MTVLFDRFPPAFFSIHQNQHKCHPPSRILNGLNRLKCRTASRNDIIDHHDQVAFLEITLNQFLPPMRFDALANDESLEGDGWIIRKRGEGDAERDRVGSHGQATDGVNFAARYGVLLDQLPADSSDEPGAP